MRVKELQHPDAGFRRPSCKRAAESGQSAYQTVKALMQGESGRQPARTFGGVRPTFVIFLSLPVVAMVSHSGNGGLLRLIQRRDRREWPRQFKTSRRLALASLPLAWDRYLTRTTSY